MKETQEQYYERKIKELNDKLGVTVSTFKRKELMLEINNYKEVLNLLLNFQGA